MGLDNLFLCFVSTPRYLKLTCIQIARYFNSSHTQTLFNALYFFYTSAVYIRNLNIDITSYRIVETFKMRLCRYFMLYCKIQEKSAFGRYILSKNKNFTLHAMAHFSKCIPDHKTRFHEYKVHSILYSN